MRIHAPNSHAFVVFYIYLELQVLDWDMFSRTLTRISPHTGSPDLMLINSVPLFALHIVVNFKFRVIARSQIPMSRLLISVY